MFLRKGVGNLRIAGWFIDGFGSLHQQSAEDLGKGLTVVVGPNEAGKSTLLAFIRAMLFGFPDGRSREGPHLPLRGGRHGGRLLVVDEPSERLFALHRYAKSPVRLIGPDGTETGEEGLRRLLGGADGPLFRNVFAFGLSELSDLARLGDEGIRDRIFSAGVAGAGRDARRVIETLTKERVALWRPGRGSSLLRDLRDRLQQNEAALEVARRSAEAYPALREEEDRAAEEARQTGAETLALRAAHRRYERLITLWPNEHELRAAEAELAALPPAVDLPPETARRWPELRQALWAQRARIREIDGQLEQAQRGVAAERPDPFWRDIAPEVQRQARAGAGAREQAREWAAARDREAEANRKAAEVLGQLGPLWDAARLALVDGGLPAEEGAQAWRQRISEVEEEERQADRQWERAAEEMESAEATVGERRQALEAAPAPAASGEREQALARIRQGLAELVGLAATVEATRTAVAVHRQLGRSPAPWAGAAAALALGGLALVLAGVDRGLVVLWLAVAAAAVIVGALLWRMGASRGRAAGAALGAAEAAAEEAEGRLEAARSALRALAEDAGLPMSCTQADVDRAQAELTIARVEWRRASEELARAQEALGRALARRDAVETRVRAASRARSEALEAWNAWKREHGLPAELSPEGVPRFLALVAQARQAMRDAEAAAASAQRQHEAVRTWCAESLALLVASGMGPTPPAAADPGQQVAALEAALGAAETRCQREAERARAAERAADGLWRVQEERRTVAAKLVELQTAYHALLEPVIASGEDPAIDEGIIEERLEGTLAREERRAALRDRIADLLRQRERALGLGPAAEELAAALRSGDLEGWRGEAARLEEAITQATAAHDAAVRRHRDAEAARQALEEAADVPGLDGQREVLLRQWTEAAREYRVLALGEALLKRTLAAYTQNRQPEVLRRASEVLAQITGGRYPQVIQGEAGSDLAVIDVRRGRHAPEELSRGTAEQLYLAVRLGLAAAFSERAVSLPLVLDDILVNFDPDRARQAIAALRTFGRDRQVLCFTCHPEIVARIRDVAPESRVIALRPDPMPAQAEVAASAE